MAVTDNKRTEIQWWIDNLTPKVFNQLPLEWISNTLPHIDQWWHLYFDEEDQCVWIVEWSTLRLIKSPCLNDSLAAVRIAALLAICEVCKTCIPDHPRVIVISFAFARVINRYSSSVMEEKIWIRSFGLLQLTAKTKITATIPLWEKHPPSHYTHSLIAGSL